MLFHCVPKLVKGDTPLDCTMRSVLVAQQGLVEAVKSEQIFSLESVKQDKSKEVRYTKNKEFTDDIAEEFLNREVRLDDREFVYPDLLKPQFG